MWQRWNQTTHIFEKSDDDGQSYVALPLSGAIITEGIVAPARLGSGATATKFLRGDSTFQTIDLSSVWPVGSVFIAVVSTNPATLLGFGTWSAFATGRVLVGIDAGQVEFDVVEETGGAKTHTLTTAEMPAHAHTGSTVAITDPGHTHGGRNLTNAAAGQSAPGVSPPWQGANPSDVDDQANKITVSNTTGITASPTIASQGGGGAHNNLPPYIVVHMWKRTA